MKMFNQFSDDFEKIILNKSFGELSSDELKALEAEGISESEFEGVRNMLKAMAELEEDKIQPSPELRSKLLSAFNEPEKKKGRIIPFQTWILTGLSAAALIALGFFIFKPGLDPASLKPELSQSIVQESESEIKNSDNFIEPAETINDTEFEIESVEPVSPAVVEESVMDVAQEEAEIVVSDNTDQEPALSKSKIDDLPEKKTLDENVPIAEPVKHTKLIQAEDLSTKSSTTNLYSSQGTTLSSTSVVSDITFPAAVEIKKTSDSMKNHKDLFATVVTIY